MICAMKDEMLFFVKESVVIWAAEAFTCHFCVAYWSSLRSGLGSFLNFEHWLTIFFYGRGLSHIWDDLDLCNCAYICVFDFHTEINLNCFFLEEGCFVTFWIVNAYWEIFALKKSIKIFLSFIVSWLWSVSYPYVREFVWFCIQRIVMLTFGYIFDHMLFERRERTMDFCSLVIFYLLILPRISFLVHFLRS